MIFVFFRDSFLPHDLLLITKSQIFLSFNEIESCVCIELLDLVFDKLMMSIMVNNSRIFHFGSLFCQAKSIEMKDHRPRLIFLQLSGLYPKDLNSLFMILSNHVMGFLTNEIYFVHY